MKIFFFFSMILSTLGRVCWSFSLTVDQSARQPALCLFVFLFFILTVLLFEAPQSNEAHNLTTSDGLGNDLGNMRHQTGNTVTTGQKSYQHAIFKISALNNQLWPKFTVLWMKLLLRFKSFCRFFSCSNCCLVSEDELQQPVDADRHAKEKFESVLKRWIIIRFQQLQRDYF